MNVCRVSCNLQWQYFFIFYFSSVQKIFPAYLQQQEKLWQFVSAENRESRAISVLGSHGESTVLLDARSKVNWCSLCKASPALFLNHFCRRNGWGLWLCPFSRPSEITSQGWKQLKIHTHWIYFWPFTGRIWGTILIPVIIQLHS